MEFKTSLGSELVDFAMEHCRDRDRVLRWRLDQFVSTNGDILVRGFGE